MLTNVVIKKCRTCTCAYIMYKICHDFKSPNQEVTVATALPNMQHDFDQTVRALRAQIDERLDQWLPLST